MKLTQRTPPRRSTAPWDDDRPIRGPRFSDEQLGRHARDLADSHVVVPRTRPVTSLLDRMRDNAKVLANNYDAIMGAVAGDESISTGSEWLIDNFHAIEQQVRHVRRDLPPGYFDLLPKLGPGFLEGHPRIFAIMWAYVAHTDSTFDADLLARYIQAYQTRGHLQIGELWAAAINLRILLVENARRLSVRLVTDGNERIRADRVADALLGIDRDGPATLDETHPQWRTVTPSIPFAVQLLRRLAEGTATDALQWVHRGLADQGLDEEMAVQQELATQSQGTLTMRNIVTSMRRLDDVDWGDWLESVSVVERELHRSEGYAELDFTTRNRYRSVIERLARRSRQDEITVARRAVHFASGGADEVGRNVGYWLVDDGLSLLEHSIGYRPGPRERMVRFVRGAGLVGYAGLVIVLTLVLAALAAWGIARWWAGASLWYTTVLGLLVVLPISHLVVSRVNGRITGLIPTDPLPALELADGVPEELRTLVVVPTMITNSADVAETLDTLETHFLANDNGEIYFAAATDWADSAQEQTADDEQVLAEMRAGIDDLNDTYGSRFLLLHRARVWNPSEGVWMGWERKRGKLEELNRVLRGAADTSIDTIAGHLPGPFRYVITLDADTRLPTVAALRLIGKMAHPLNRPRFAHDGEDAKVVRGYTILQPRVTPSLPAAEETSHFQTMYTTRQGLDPYAFAVADVYQDLFDEGSFAGKGIYDIAALERSLAQRIPQNAVLSHDLLEGNYSRSGFVSDVEVVEEHPLSYAVHNARLHRWTRGDWQLLPWIFGRRRRDISALGRWKMIDNLRRSLAPIMAVVALLAGAVLLPAGPLAGWIAVLGGSYLLPLVIPRLAGLLAGGPNYTVRSRLVAGGRDLLRSLGVAALDFILLAHQAYAMTDAIVRTLWRMVVSRRRLLEWTTAAASVRSARDGADWFARRMAGGLIAPVLLLALGIVRGPAMLVVVFGPVLFWSLAPVVAAAISRPFDLVERTVSPEAAKGLRVVARRTWRFFEVFVTPAENDLPPDNFQDDPADRIAHRTSPTNLGVYYLSTVAARDLGWIGLAETAERLFATMATQISLDHYRGHLFNWYDTASTHVLSPRYISSVDSGNLAGHLIVLANACAELASHDPRADDVRTGIHDGLDCVAQTDPAVNLGGVRVAVDTVPVGTPEELEAWRRIVDDLRTMAETRPSKIRLGTGWRPPPPPSVPGCVTWP